MAADLYLLAEVKYSDYIIGQPQQKRERCVNVDFLIDQEVKGKERGQYGPENQERKGPEKKPVANENDTTQGGGFHTTPHQGQKVVGLFYFAREPEFVFFYPPVEQQSILIHIGLPFLIAGRLGNAP